MSDMTEYKTTSLKPVDQWTDREISEQMVKLMYLQEKHMKYVANVLTGYIIVTFIAACIVVANIMN